MSSLYLAWKSSKLESCNVVLSDLFPLHQQFSRAHDHVLDIGDVPVPPSALPKHCITLIPLTTLQAHKALTFCPPNSVLTECVCPMLFYLQKCFCW